MWFCAHCLGNVCFGAERLFWTLVLQIFCLPCCSCAGGPSRVIASLVSPIHSPACAHSQLDNIAIGKKNVFLSPLDPHTLHSMVTDWLLGCVLLTVWRQRRAETLAKGAECRAGTFPEKIKNLHRLVGGFRSWRGHITGHPIDRTVQSLSQRCPTWRVTNLTVYFNNEACAWVHKCTSL